MGQGQYIYIYIYRKMVIRRLGFLEQRYSFLLSFLSSRRTGFSSHFCPAPRDWTAITLQRGSKCCNCDDTRAVDPNPTSFRPDLA